MTRRAPRGNRGFTLVELAVAMPIMLVIMGGLVVMLTTVTHWTSETQEETTLQTEARGSLNRLEAEIRGAFIGQGSNIPFVSATSTSITFDTPDSASTTVTGTPPTESSFHLMQVSYRISGGTLQRQFETTTNTYPGSLTGGWTWGSLSSWATVVGSVNSVTNTDVFSYYQSPAQGSAAPTLMSFPIANLGAIVAVGVKLALSTGGSQPEHFTVSDLIAVRGNS